jgi:hypothetical protein
MEAKAHKSKFEKLLSDSEFNRFGLICVILTIVGCLGGIAVGMGALGNTLATTIIIIPTMVTLSLLLAVAPMKWIMMAGIVSSTIDILFIIYFTLLA